MQTVDSVVMNRTKGKASAMIDIFLPVPLESSF